jgi:hypothetical protein
VAFNAEFALLAARFDYPDILRRPTTGVLAAFHAGGTPIIVLWWAFTLTAVLLAPVVVLVSHAIGDADPTPHELPSCQERGRVRHQGAG